jgi:hypothetical protein
MQQNKRLKKHQRQERKINKSQQIKQDYIKNKDTINTKREKKIQKIQNI